MMEPFTFGGEIVWNPTPAHIEQANLTRFMRMHHIADYDELMNRSTEDIAWFTDAVLDFLDIQFHEPYSKVVDFPRGIQFPTWCVGAKMNIVHNCVDKYRESGVSDQVAVSWEGEEGVKRTLTYEELYKEVNKTANALRSLGLGKGDAIGIFMPMVPELPWLCLRSQRSAGSSCHCFQDMEQERSFHVCKTPMPRRSLQPMVPFDAASQWK
jgi:acetyl-CoA synthetase